MEGGTELHVAVKKNNQANTLLIQKEASKEEDFEELA